MQSQEGAREGSRLPCQDNPVINSFLAGSRNLSEAGAEAFDLAQAPQTAKPTKPFVNFNLERDLRGSLRAVFEAVAARGEAPAEPAAWCHCRKLLFDEALGEGCRTLANVYCTRALYNLPAWTSLGKCDLASLGGFRAEDLLVPSPLSRVVGAAMGLGAVIYGLPQSELGVHLLQELSLAHAECSPAKPIQEVLRLLYRGTIFPAGSGLAQLLEKPEPTHFERALCTGVLELFRQTNGLPPEMSSDLKAQRLIFQSWLLRPGFKPELSEMKAAADNVTNSGRPYQALIAAAPLLGHAVKMDPGLNEFIVTKLTEVPRSNSFSFLNMFMLGHPVPRDLLSDLNNQEGLAAQERLLRLTGFALTANYIYQQDSYLFEKWRRQLAGQSSPRKEERETAGALRRCFQELITKGPHAPELCRALKAVEYGGELSAASYGFLKGLVKPLADFPFREKGDALLIFFRDFSDRLEVRRASSRHHCLGFQSLCDPPLSPEHVRFLRNLVKGRYDGY